jgi:hypothetical protein
MAAGKMNIKIWVVVPILVITAWLLGSVSHGRAETMKCRSSGNVVKMEVIPIPDVEGHAIGVIKRDGLAFFEGGEVATFNALATFDAIGGKGAQAQGYILFTFVDGSSIITTFRQPMEPDPGGKFTWDSKFTGEILKGTGRFLGIKGSLSGTGKQFKPEKGELTGKSFNDWTLTCTLPGK